MNRGDTALLMLDYTVNGEPLVEGAYQEIELLISSIRASVRKTLTNNDIKWETVTFESEGEEKTFTGYVCRLDQDDTFRLNEQDLSVQLRIMLNDEVGSSDISDVELGRSLSNKVLVA